MTEIDLTSDNDKRRKGFKDGYDTKSRMIAFIGSWKDESKREGENTWSHIGVYCGERFGRNLKKQERRLVYLGLLVAYINSDRCAHWTNEQREQALHIVWEYIDSKR